MQLHTNTPVTSIVSPDERTKCFVIHTPRGVIKARHVVNATNAWIGHLYPEFRGKIVATRGQVIHVNGRNLTLNPMGWNDGGEYLIQRPDSSLIFGGGRPFATGTYPISHLTIEHAEIGNADDTSIDPTVSQFLHTFLPSQFPFVETVGTEPPVNSIREWTGIMGFSHDTHPYVGHSPEEPRKWIIGGFHGHGMVRIWLCGKALVEQLLAKESDRRIPWPKWMPRGYIYHPDRYDIDEVKEYLSSV
jgi:glycine/D-amino acid oxidase-like deaminating enzyme